MHEKWHHPPLLHCLDSKPPRRLRRMPPHEGYKSNYIWLKWLQDHFVVPQLIH